MIYQIIHVYFQTHHKTHVANVAVTILTKFDNYPYALQLLRK